MFHRYYPKRIDLKNGFGFIEFGDERDARDCISAMDGFRFDQRRLLVQLARGARNRDDDRGGRGNFGGNDSRGGSSGGGGGRGGPRTRGFRCDVTGLDARTSWQVFIIDLFDLMNHPTYYNLNIAGFERFC